MVLEEEIPSEVRREGMVLRWIRALSPEIWRNLQIKAIERVEVEVKRGPSNVTDRLMVRALADLTTDLTSVVPSRTYRHANKSGGPTGEHYWFLDLVTKLAEFVNQALPLHIRRPGAAALTGIVAEELEQLRNQQASSAR